MSKSMEERIEAAIIARFFEPTWMSTPQQIIDPSTGTVRIQNTMSQTPAPMTIVAEAIYRQAQAEIIRKVIEQLDIDAIVEQWAPKIAEDVVKQLQVQKPEYWQAQPNKTERQKMMDKVYEDVAAEFGRQAVEHLRKTGGLMAVLEA